MRQTAFVIALLFPIAAGAVTVALDSTTPSPAHLGSTIVFTAAGSDVHPGKILYQFSVARSGLPSRVTQDYGISSGFAWTPYIRDGIFSIGVTARNETTGETATANKNFRITPLVSGSLPVISKTNHPLVALYSAPECAVGSALRVRYSIDSRTEVTNAQPCVSGITANQYVAGLLPESTYRMNYEVVTGGQVTSGPVQKFTTGPINSNVPFPPITQIQPPTRQISGRQNVLLLDFLPTLSSTYVPTALDLLNRIIWYYPGLASPDQAGAFGLRPVANANTFLLIANDPEQAVTQQQLLREIDLAGNTVRQTSVYSVSKQLVNSGKLGITSFHHDAVRLENGHTLVIASQEKLFPPGTQGATGPLQVDVIGDAVVDLDENLQVVWSWSAFDQLDISRRAVLDETCRSGQTGCPPVLLGPIANDWLHPNSLYYEAASGDIIVSLRHQDWLIKVDYKNGTGTGAVLWRMGRDGDFAFNSTDPYPWFSHQHDAEYESRGGTAVLSLYDNGNTRVSQNPGVTENSRGMVLNVDESNRVVTPVLAADLGVFSAAVGSAQKLDNGNYYFESGFLLPDAGQSVEVSPTGSILSVLQYGTFTYRGYRMDTLNRLDVPN